MTVNEFVKKYNIDVKNCCVEYEDGSLPAGFIYETDAEYRRLFDRYYGDMEVINAYVDEDYGYDILIVK
jgi:hypothetical protein